LPEKRKKRGDSEVKKRVRGSVNPSFVEERLAKITS
jgi:hypothetical protein